MHWLSGSAYMAEDGVESWPRKSKLSLLWEDGPARGMCSGPFSQWVPTTLHLALPEAMIHIPKPRAPEGAYPERPPSPILPSWRWESRGSEVPESKAQTWKQAPQLPTLSARPQRLLKHRNVSPSIQDQQSRFSPGPNVRVFINEKENMGVIIHLSMNSEASEPRPRNYPLTHL